MVPHAITMGLKSIMNARRILLLASGEDKSDAVYQAVFGDVMETFPASIKELLIWASCTDVTVWDRSFFLWPQVQSWLKTVTGQQFF